MSTLEVISQLPNKQKRIRAILFDFDGTISTLRQGWEEVMTTLMMKKIGGSDPTIVNDYINESTGIQTIEQMEWLAQKVKDLELAKSPDPWAYKAEYNKMLLKKVNSRLYKLINGDMAKEDFVICGAHLFLSKMKRQGIELFLASGTDHPNVVLEAEALGVKDFFTRIEGAPVDKKLSSKEKLLKCLLFEQGYLPSELLVVGDGKVEISLGKKHGALTLGVASNEERREGINPTKRDRLIRAGAHAICGDFQCYKEIVDFFYFG